MTLLSAQALRRLFRFGIASKSLTVPIWRRISSTRCLFADRYFTRKHEWVVTEGNVATVGISDFAQSSLGDIVYAELPEVGKELNVGDSAGALESVKAASDIYSPISGTVMEKNSEVESNPTLINKSPFDKGWLFKVTMKNVDELKNLMSETTYEEYKKVEELQASH